MLATKLVWIQQKQQLMVDYKYVHFKLLPSS